MKTSTSKQGLSGEDHGATMTRHPAVLCVAGRRHHPVTSLMGSGAIVIAGRKADIFATEIFPV